MMDRDDIVLGRPSKSFFIDMITRDLSVTDCILDLMDNAVDKAVETSQVDVTQILMEGRLADRFEGATVKLKVSPNSFLIEDTCGGISIDEAKRTAFLFGNPGERGADAGLSVYGIGMKRAFFKLGRTISVRSATKSEWFEIDIDVENWQAKGDKDWDFEFSKKGQTTDKSLQRSGTRIEIRRLRPEVSERFAQVSFVRNLEDKISQAYALFVKAGLDVSVNGNSIAVNLPSIASDARLTPARKIMTVHGIDILIVVGVTPKDSRTLGGWYVFCNGRMVLQADRSEKTGWGVTRLLPKWHTKYGHFVGYVYFRSKDVRSLPWTTTKQDIEIDAPVYQSALTEMQIQSRPVLSYLNSLYADDLEPTGVPERVLLESVQPVAIDQVSRSDATFHVQLEHELNTDPDVTIQYRKKKSEIERVRECVSKLRRASFRKIGEYTFDYFVDQECK